MKKYKLAKGIPFAEAGTKIENDEKGNIIIPLKNHNNMWYSPEEIETLISEGWIEEVEPRSGYLVVPKNVFNFRSQEEAEQDLRHSHPNIDLFEIIHVQEID